MMTYDDQNHISVSDYNCSLFISIVFYFTCEHPYDALVTLLSILYVFFVGMNDLEDWSFCQKSQTIYFTDSLYFKP